MLDGMQGFTRTGEIGAAVAVIGPGRVGTAFAVALHAAGERVVAVAGRTVDEAAKVADRVGALATSDAAEAARMADLVLLAVPDDEIAHVASAIAAEGGFRAGQVVAHTSGARGQSELHAASDAGAYTGCVHPLQTFATAEQAVRDLPGSVFGITADPEALPTLDALVRTLRGTPVEIAPENRALYHAAAVVASNCFVALEDIAAELLERAGFPEDAARDALAPLVRATAANIERLGPRGALTGPVARGDVDTVRAHLDALDAVPATERETYRLLSLRAVQMAAARGDLSPEAASGLARLLGQERRP